MTRPFIVFYVINSLRFLQFLHNTYECQSKIPINLPKTGHLLSFIPFWNDQSPVHCSSHHLTITLASWKIWTATCLLWYSSSGRMWRTLKLMLSPQILSHYLQVPWPSSWSLRAQWQGHDPSPVSHPSTLPVTFNRALTWWAKKSKFVILNKSFLITLILEIG